MDGGFAHAGGGDIAVGQSAGMQKVKKRKKGRLREPSATYQITLMEDHAKCGIASDALTHEGDRGIVEVEEHGEGDWDFNDPFVMLSGMVTETVYPVTLMAEASTVAGEDDEPEV